MKSENAHYHQLIQQLYTSFRQLDAEGMKSCYHEDATFSDPVFTHLKGKEIGGMWTMLVKAIRKSGDPWKLDFSDCIVIGETVTCRWEAHYTFSLTRRNVHNIIHAEFAFKDGKIIRHNDHFDFYRWSRMAFGLTGTMLGWTPIFRNKLQQQSAKRLNEFMLKES